MIERRTYVYSWRNIWYIINMDKNIFTIRENDLSYGRGYVYSLQYHLVWCTKYRKKVLENGLDEECKKMLYEIADEYKFQIVAMEVMPDHIHLLVDCKPQFYISDMIKIMKGNYERKSCTAAFSFSSGIKTGIVGRTFVESVILCSNSQ